ncbi:ATP-binding protein [Micromonospora echinofusca]|uniref:AAA family ATPase n=1 Tax=Micromonospora echinofusca TaxID=47858 RepID=UPI00332E2024
MQTAEDRMAITSITMKNFRSVNGEWTLSLLKDGQAASLLALGENGSGKSTVADALEFALQGSRRPLTWRNIFAGPAEESWCTVVLNSSPTSVTRVNRAGERHPSDKPADARFSKSNFVIKRHEIDRFSSLPDKERSELLAGYIKMREGSWLEGNGEREKLVLELATLKLKRAEELKRFAELEGLADDALPAAQKGFESYVLRRRGGTPGLSKAERRALPALPSELQELTHSIRTLDGKIGDAQGSFYELNRRLRAERLSLELSAIGQDVTDAFLRLAPPNQGVRRISFEVGSSDSPAIDIVCEFENGLKVTPFKILNEASLDLLALLTFINLTRAATRHGQEKLLVLDDVFSSADSGLRMRFAAYLFEEFADWQIVAIFHDRLWYEQFRRAASNATHPAVLLEFGRRKPMATPLAYDAPADASNRVRSKLADPAADKQDLASATGLLLETLCEHLSVSLRIKVERKLDEEYTIGELWPGIKAVLRGTSAETTASQVQDVVHLRNLVGAHFMTWSQSVTYSECEQFATAVLALWDKTYCLTCRYFVGKTRGRTPKCRCGQVTL